MSDEEIDKNLQGTWVSDAVNVAEDFKEGFATAGDIADYFELDEFNVKLAFTFKDGTYEVKFDEDSMKEVAETMKEPLKKAMVKYLEAEITKSTGMTLEEVLKTLNAKDVEEYYASVVGETIDATIDEMLKDLPSEFASTIESGKYEVKGGKVTMTSDDGTTTFEYDGKTNTITYNDKDYGKILMTKK